jgi:hypothetical protein
MLLNEYGLCWIRICGPTLNTKNTPSKPSAKYNPDKLIFIVR